MAGSVVSHESEWRAKVFGPAVTSMLAAMGSAVVERARELVPVDTGQLRDSIGYTVRQSDMTVSIHADKFYSRWVEFGSRRQPARPFLRPALMAARNWKNRSVNTELHFGGAGPGVRKAGVDTTAGHKAKGFKRLTTAFHKAPTVTFHPRHTRSIL